MDYYEESENQGHEIKEYIMKCRNRMYPMYSLMNSLGVP